MKKLLFILYVFCSIKSFAQIDTIGISQLGLKGNVKKVTEFTFKAIDKLGTIQKGEMVDDEFAIDDGFRKTNFSYSFNGNGQQVEHAKYWNPGSIKSIKNYYYINDHINSTLEKMIFSDATITIKEIFKYNIHDLVESCTRYRNNSLFEKYLYSYDEKNNIVKEVNINNNGEIDNEITYERAYSNGKEVYLKTIDSDYGTDVVQSKYDSIGRLIEEYVNYDNNRIKTIKYYYTDFNKIKSSVTFNNKSGKVDISSHYKYDDSYRLIEIKHILGDGKCETTSISYDGTIQKESISTANGNKIIRIKKEGNIINYTTNDNEFNYEYIFDKKGNWIKITEFKNTIPTFIRERTILYHI